MTTQTQYESALTLTAKEATRQGVTLTRDDERRIAYTVTCDFLATDSGRSYTARSCSDAATWIEAWDNGGPVYTNQYGKRCDRHRRIDERTARNRGWGGREYIAFDAKGRIEQEVTSIRTRAEAEAQDAIYQKVFTAARYLLAHVDLTDGQRGCLQTIVDEGYALTVK